MTEQERNTFRKLLIEHQAITDFDDENPHVAIYLDDLVDLVDEIRERNSKIWSELLMKANAMYSAAQYLSTDASQLRKAMAVANKIKQETVDKVCDILNHYCNRTGVHPSRRVDIINHIRKAMEE